MKRLVSLLLALSLALALTACGQKDTAPDTTQTDDPQTEQAEDRKSTRLNSSH